MYSTAIINWDQLSLVVGDENEPGDEEMIDLYRLFVEDASQRLRAINDPDRTFNPVLVAKEAHKIRGAASSFGFEQVSTLLRTIETEIDELSFMRVTDLLREAQQTFDQSVVEVRGRYPALSS